MRRKKKREFLKNTVRRRMMLRKRREVKLKKKKRREHWMKKKDGRRYKREKYLRAYMPHRYLFHTKRWEKQLQEKFLKFLEHMRKVEIKIPFLEVMEQMLQYAKYLKTLMGNKNKLESKVVNLLEQVNAII